MRPFLLFFLIALSSIGCQKRVDKEIPIISDQLQLELDKIILQSDNISKTQNPQKKIKSIWIVFYDFKDTVDCIGIETYHTYYNEKKCDGFFTYKDKIISLYGLKNSFSTKFIDINRVLHSNKKIPELKSVLEKNEIIGGFLYELFTVEKDGKLRRCAKV